MTGSTPEFMLTPSTPGNELISTFFSDREQRLWLWTAVVLVAIYSSLGLAPMLAEELRERNLLRVSFALVLLLMVGAVVWQWVKRRPGWRDVGVALGVAFAYLVTFARMGSPEERTHLVEYGVVAALIHQALLERVRHGGQVPKPAALTVAFTAVLGVLDESIQSILPNRVFAVADIFFNALAGFMVVVARLAIAPQRRLGWRFWFLWFMGGAVGFELGMQWGAFAEPGGINTFKSSPTVMWAGFLGVAVAGVLVGMLQWLVLRRHVARAGRWVLASLGAAAIVGVVMFGVGTVNADAAWLLGLGLFGPVVGVLHWLVLRRQVARAGWVVLASTVGWIVGMPVGDAVAWFALGGAYAIATGTTLVWLLRRGQAITRAGRLAH